MPEQISKYPQVTLKVLKGTGARCGDGVKQRILTQCPPERFCALPTGEICVYGIEEIPKMTQISTQELARVVCPPEQQSSMGSATLSSFDVTLLGATFAVGLVVGRFWRSFMKR
ncbi:MAG: hypothetical protein ACE5JO_06465 [Candidatus Binatia bacterium]